MQRFRRMRCLLKFASVHNHFILERSLSTRLTVKKIRAAALAEWHSVFAA